MYLSDPLVRKLFSLLYLAGALILADQVLDLLAAILAVSAQPSIATWRFGVFGLVAGRLNVFLVADAFLFAAALVLEHRLVLRSLGWTHLALTAIGLIALLFFGLDFIEIRGRARGTLNGSVNVAALRAGLAVGLTSVLCAWTGLASVRATRRTRRKGHSREVPTLFTRPPKDKAPV